MGKFSSRYEFAFAKYTNLMEKDSSNIFKTINIYTGWFRTYYNKFNDMTTNLYKHMNTWKKTGVHCNTYDFVYRVINDSISQMIQWLRLGSVNFGFQI